MNAIVINVDLSWKYELQIYIIYQNIINTGLKLYIYSYLTPVALRQDGLSHPLTIQNHKNSILINPHSPRATLLVL